MAGYQAPTSNESTESFKALMDQTVLSGFKFAGIALGVKLNLFEAFGKDPMTSEEVATSANLKERYVREWLRHMVVCDVVDVDPSGTKFSLPAHRKDVLTDSNSLTNTLGPAFSSMLIPHAEVVSCFRADGPIGLPFETVFPFFAERVDKNVGNLSACAELFRDKVPGLREKLESGIRLLEVGSGSGVVLVNLASQFPNSEFYGVDLSDSLTNQATERMNEKGLKNIHLFLQDATALPSDWDNSFDAIVMRDVLHDISHATKALENIFRCLKPGGHFSVLEVNVHSNVYESLQSPSMKALGQLVYVISTYHCLPASLVTPGSEGLGAGSGIEHFSNLMKKVGFVLDGEPQAADSVNVHFQATKPLN